MKDSCQKQTGMIGPKDGSPMKDGGDDGGGLFLVRDRGKEGVRGDEDVFGLDTDSSPPAQNDN
jgi:hypothetical protein